jgi:hypothetical protein
MKKCNKCLVEKELDMFPKTGTRCKECVASYKKEYALLNKEKIKEYKKEYYLENKEDIMESKKVYYQSNKDIILLKSKEYVINNIDKVKDYRNEYNKNNPNLEYHKKYREDNREEISEKRKEYYKKNKDKIKKYQFDNKEHLNSKKKEYRDVNKDYFNSLNREYIKNKKINDPLYKLTCSIRTLITQSFKGQFTKKSKKTIEILGCDFETFKEHIESQFKDDMSWNNYASYWQLDHKTPISWSECEEDVYKLNHYTNFQPLFWKENISKGNRWKD